MPQPSPLITAAELQTLLASPDLRIVDASWHLDGRDGRIDFERERIPGAVFFDLEAGSDRSSPLPHMLPTAAAFAAHAAAAASAAASLSAALPSVSGTRTSAH